ncbi:MAG: ligand-binding protein SH3, partial [Desulforhopalus sp.]
HLTLLLSSFGVFGEDGALQRYQIEYELSDDAMVKTGLVFYQSGDYLPFQDIDDNDRIFIELEYRF